MDSAGENRWWIAAGSTKAVVLELPRGGKNDRQGMARLGIAGQERDLSRALSPPGSSGAQLHCRLPWRLSAATRGRRRDRVRRADTVGLDGGHHLLRRAGAGSSRRRAAGGG